MSARSYDENCGVARALDVLGERWTLLIVRELLLGPRRYRDLAEALDGIGTNLLAARLKSLEAAGVIRRVTLPPPAGVQAYELTERGEELRPVVLGLGRWGFGLDAPWTARKSRAEWLFSGLQAFAQSVDLAPLGETLMAFRVDGEHVWLRTSAGALEVHVGVPQAEPDVDVETDLATLTDVATGRLALADVGRRATIRGDAALLGRLFELVRLPVPA
jgi:DNA-binding HxlR family transcriptional regulator